MTRGRPRGSKNRLSVLNQNADHGRGLKIVVPDSFDAVAYLTELMQQMPGTDGRIEISRQLSAMLERKNPFSIGYLYNVRAGRQPLTEQLKRALWIHSQKEYFDPNPEKISEGNIYQESISSKTGYFAVNPK